MGIEKIEVYRTEMTYVEPFRIALGISEKSRKVAVKVYTDYSVSGIGEASPSERITGETVETVLSALKRISPRLIGECPMEAERWTEVMDMGARGNPSAKAALDIAIHDIIGNTVGKPLYELLGGYRSKIASDITIGIKAPDEMAISARRFVSMGFKTIKAKVGIDPDEDVERVKSIRRAVGKNVKIRVDANQGWTVAQAIRTLRKIDRFDVELVEQPVKAEDIDGLRRVRKASSIPVMADESVHFPSDAIRVIKADAVDYINIKLMKCGGVWQAKKISTIAESAGIPCMVGCMSESGIGIAAGVHFAAATRSVKFADLDSDLLLRERIVLKGGAATRRGERVLADRPGLGIKAIDMKLLGKPIAIYK